MFAETYPCAHFVLQKVHKKKCTQLPREMTQNSAKPALQLSREKSKWFCRGPCLCLVEKIHLVLKVTAWVLLCPLNLSEVAEKNKLTTIHKLDTLTLQTCADSVWYKDESSSTKQLKPMWGLCWFWRPLWTPFNPIQISSCCFLTAESVTHCEYLQKIKVVSSGCNHPMWHLPPLRHWKWNHQFCSCWACFLFQRNHFEFQARFQLFLLPLNHFQIIPSV